MAEARLFEEVHVHVHVGNHIVKSTLIMFFLL